MRRLLIAYKERGRRDLARELAFALALAVRRVAGRALGRRSAGAGRPVLLVPVPASRAALRARGFDHVGLLARHAARLIAGWTGVPTRWLPVLEPARRVADQAGLTAAARSANVAGSMRARAGRAAAVARGSPQLVLVDDVLTSGATLAEAARALAAAGLHTSAAAVVAAAVRPDPAGTHGPAIPYPHGLP